MKDYLSENWRSLDLFLHTVKFHAESRGISLQNKIEMSSSEKRRNTLKWEYSNSKEN